MDRDPTIEEGGADGQFAAGLAAFDAFGRTTRRSTLGGVALFENEFWTARQRQAHSLHEISYRACFKPQLPRFFIERFTEPGDLVYDPFAGRGTTLIEAALLGRRALGNDVNPLSAMLTLPRLDPPSSEAIAERLARLARDLPEADGDAALLAFYHPATLKDIARLRRHFLSADVDALDAWVRMLCLNRLTGHSSGFFSVYTLPPNQAVSLDRQRKINQQRGQVPPQRDVFALLSKKSRALLKDPIPPGFRRSQACMLTEPAERTPAIVAGSVDLIVTSPPFLDVVDYPSDNWLRCWFAGIEPARVPIALHRSLAAWERFVAGCLVEFARVLRPGGIIAFEVGEVRGGRIALEEAVLRAAEGSPLTPLAVMVNAQSFTKTAQCWGVANNDKGTNSNRIVILERR